MGKELAKDINLGDMPTKAADDAAISVRGLTKRFGETIAVDNIDLQIRKGELFGLLGANGAGKSTIIKMLTTMLTPHLRRGQGLGLRHRPGEERGAILYRGRLSGSCIGWHAHR